MLLGIPDDIHEEKPSFLKFKKKRITDGPTDGLTDGQTDKASYRDAWTHLKIHPDGNMIVSVAALGRQCFHCKPNRTIPTGS